MPADPGGVEWVEGSPRWWVYLWLPSLPLLAVGVAVLVDMVFAPPSLGSEPWFIVGAFVPVFVALLLQWSVRYRYPTIRRIGLSREAIVLDLGLRRIAYPWGEVARVVQTNVRSHSRYGEEERSTRTRIVLGKGILRADLALTTGQAERLQRFLQIPPPAPSSGRLG